MSFLFTNECHYRLLFYKRWDAASDYPNLSKACCLCPNRIPNWTLDKLWFPNVQVRIDTSLSYLCFKSYYRETSFVKTFFFSFCSLEAKPLTLGQIWGHFSEKALKDLSNAFLSAAVALLVPEFCDDLLKNVEKAKFDLWWMTSGYLAFDLT